MLWTVRKKEVINGKEFDFGIMTYDKTELAIKYKWNALAFCDNEESFGSISCGNYNLDLVTNGEVCILDKEQNIELSNYDYIEISKLVESNEIYSERYEIIDSNHFAIMLSKSDDIIPEEHILQWDVPESIDDLIDFLCQCMKEYILENEDSSIVKITNILGHSTIDNITYENQTVISLNVETNESLDSDIKDVELELHFDRKSLNYGYVTKRYYVPKDNSSDGYSKEHFLSSAEIDLINTYFKNNNINLYID